MGVISPVLFHFIKKGCIDLKELNGTIVNTLIQRIEVFNPVKVNGKRHVPVKIYFTAVGILDIPDEDEILKIRLKKYINPLDKSYRMRYNIPKQVARDIILR